jgi:hypothetical protein
LAGLLGVLVGGPPAHAQLEIDRPPIEYSSGPLRDPVAVLQQRLDAGTSRLDFDARFGYLKSVLAELKISASSQMLVFSKTSFQQHRISPNSPRALYFNDEAYVGWVPYGEVMEVTAVDPQQGAIFYTLRQQATDRPQFVRDQGNCLTCHASARTQGVPGHLVRSVFASPSGLPHFGAGTFNTNHQSPLEERWGGWYVTGTHGKQRHMGNVVASDEDHPVLDTQAGANITSLEGHTRIGSYLTGHSDIVALMVLEHQTEMQNLITRANYETRLALHQGAVMNRALERPDDYVSESTQRRIASAAEKLLRYMLFVDEAPLTDPIQGTSGFAQEFSGEGPRDPKGRSLRDLDLERRLFRYPCSYQIYSEAFAGLPNAVKEHVYRRLWEVLTGQDASECFARLSPTDRQAIHSILSATLTDLPSYWKSAG